MPDTLRWWGFASWIVAFTDRVSIVKNACGMSAIPAGGLKGKNEVGVDAGW